MISADKLGVADGVDVGGTTFKGRLGLSESADGCIVGVGRAGAIVEVFTWALALGLGWTVAYGRSVWVQAVPITENIASKLRILGRRIIPTG
ncbi:MAG: hypothetical protein O2909_08755 [Chloroflexi bacterium]|nr:hypothetical protein [Chloroflexota bacterium]MDA1219516.1 hypothetical protein [Chloroflexota bacterium]PKB57864.1 MAG: hypothetical protein BZY73_01040 [SAR202 cluster bacterium Casp-Chloro-G3]